MIKVLIVEDDPMVAELNKSYLLRVGGFEPAGVAATGAEARAFLAQGEEVSLILLDVFMPELDGLALLREIRREHPGLDVIMVTAARSGAEIQEALRLGVIDYIVKPFVFDRFQAALVAYQDRRRLLRGKKELNQAALDSRIFTRPARETRLPKGIDADTLKHVRRTLAHCRDFSLKDAEPLTGLSRVSLKKYLDYLQDCGELAGDAVYSRMGRPVRVYRWL